MKTSNPSIVSTLRIARFKTCLAAVLGIGMLILGTTCIIAPAHAGPPSEQEGKILRQVVELAQKAQVAELLDLLANFHGALSYGGNIDAMMSLWADDSSLTFNGTPHVGKAAVQDFFTTGGYFLNNWVSLAPEYKTQITIHGNTAQFSTQCVAIDLNASPMVVKSVIQVTGTAVRVHGNWIFKSMNNTSPAPL